MLSAGAGMRFLTLPDELGQLIFRDSFLEMHSLWYMIGPVAYFFYSLNRLMDKIGFLVRNQLF